MTNSTAFIVYSPPFISDAFVLSGFTTEENAKSSFEESKKFLNKTAGAYLVRLDNLSDEEYEILTGDAMYDNPELREKYRDAVVNHFESYDVTIVDSYEDSADAWVEGSLSAHGDLPEGVDYQITV